ncbi:MAG: hypothetical protein NZ553_12700 [Caldilinea sp.]|nr:hypothetical protein [Caldilinea sp.]MDW8441328.1 hypothetical protein [Caldilineaceae bacterium]
MMAQRNNRWVIRLSFIAVLGMGLLGFGYAVSVWLPMLDAVDLSTFTEAVDWVDVVAGIGEQGIQLFLGVASGQ